jgi:hypothetical protein
VVPAATSLRALCSEASFGLAARGSAIPGRRCAHPALHLRAAAGRDRVCAPRLGARGGELGGVGGDRGGGGVGLDRIVALVLLLVRLGIITSESLTYSVLLLKRQCARNLVPPTSAVSGRLPPLPHLPARRGSRDAPAYLRFLKFVASMRVLNLSTGIVIVVFTKTKIEPDSSEIPTRNSDIVSIVANNGCRRISRSN